MSGKKELTLSEDDVREEHLAEVNAGAQAGYLAVVLLGSLLLMVLLIAALGTSSG